MPHDVPTEFLAVVECPPILARQLPRWFMWSPMAHFVRSASPD